MLSEQTPYDELKAARREREHAHENGHSDAAQTLSGDFAVRAAAERLRLAYVDREGEVEATRPLTMTAAAWDDAMATPLPTTLSLLMERLGASRLSEISADPPAELLADRLDPAGLTVLHGTGGVGKGAVTAWWLVQLVRAGHRPLILDYERHPDEWARRVDGLGGPGIREAILHVAPHGSSWQARRGAIWQQQAEIRELALAWGATVLVIDSIVPACAGFDPMKPESASQFAAAIEYVGLPTLALAHVTKADDARYPFGSVFWHNLARVTWSLERDGERAMLTARKANNYARTGKFAVTVTWRDGVLREVWEEPYSESLSDRLAELLVQPMTVTQLVAELNAEDDAATVKADSVRAALRRGRDRFRADGERWALA